MKKIILALLSLLALSCGSESKDDGKLKVVTTTTMVTDMVKNIGGDLITVEGLMGSGVDPHLYKASEGDVSKLYNADLIIYNGLHLEGKLVDVFEKMDNQGKNTMAISDALEEQTLIGSEYFDSNYDPHIWFDTDYWKTMSKLVAQRLTQLQPSSAAQFESNLEGYIKEIDELDVALSKKIDELPANKRILVTAHDAFNYFGRTYGFEVVGLQGLSTATEAGVKDVQRLTQFIIDNQVKAVFIESSVPRRTVEALQEAVRAQDYKIQIGGELYSDALGSSGTPEGTYTGMYRHNVNTIVNALK